MVLDVLESKMVTKSDFALFQEDLANRFEQAQLKTENQIRKAELRVILILGSVIAATATLVGGAVAWFIQFSIKTALS